MKLFSYEPLRVPLILLVVVGGGGVLGFAVGAANQGRANAGSVPSDLGEYTFENNDCSAGDRKDPINVIFTHHGFESEIKQQAINHGDWEVQGNITQWFSDQEGCFESEGQPASNRAGADRYHMRHYNHKAMGGGQRSDPTFGSISSAAAHHEDTISPLPHPVGHPECYAAIPPPPIAHAVDDNDEEFSFPWATVKGGYNLGREDIRKNWVEDSDHVLENTFYWDTSQMFEQCDGGMAWSDGKVYYIRTFDATADYDGDGCTNEAELQIISGTERSGGQRDPANPWDFYDVSVPKDGVIDLPNDILGVILRFAPGGYPAGDEIYDRGPAKGTASWIDTHPPDGVIDLPNDILGVIQQALHRCQ